ncbi:ribosomal protein S9/S16-domain-containing protein [Rhodotorula diobovata]|uniref:Ribosomal protein S9/S16-domain-containing protein n=1 Tax=Rhodotorula diobovata TaxID=5288 RepID=A0A5C5FNE4_9BASI|nr:ribosomal protein S9/S16-domain-containing protein [Rhodotorula diobovata]
MAAFPRAAARPLRAAATTTAPAAARAASTAVSSSASPSRQFFPVQSSPSGPVRPTAKPPSQEWYTARPSLTQTLAQLDHAVTQSRAHLFRQGLLRSISQSIAHDAEFAAVLPHPRQRRWKPAKDMAAYLRTGAQLKSSQYKRLTATLAHLEGLVPYARVADSLALDSAVEPSSAAPALVVDPVALATRRGLADPDSARGEPAHGLAAQLEQLLARFQQPAALSSTGVAVERVAGQARRLGAQDAQQRVLAVGRRKESGARVWIVPTAAAAPPSSSSAEAPEAEDEAPLGRVLVNTLPLPSYFSQLPHREAVVRPLSLTSSLGAFNVFAIVKGGGQAAQADAVAMGLARALAEWERAEVEAGRRDEVQVSWRDVLKRAKLIERDPRVVERKKTGRVKARKMPTWVKR